MTNSFENTDNSGTNNVQLADYNILENIKENIKPQRQGRSATSIARVLQIPSNELGLLQIQQKNHFESLINNYEDLDDPLEPFIGYIKWIEDNFPEGPNNNNGLISVMELCTNAFKDNLIYKNDPRYLKVWIKYASYSENPADVFVFLYRKEIGLLLSVFYEEYARILEESKQYDQANQVFQKGLLIEAKPSKRLQTKYNQFRVRVSSVPKEVIEQQGEIVHFDPFPKRKALSLKSGSFPLLVTPDDEEGTYPHPDEEPDNVERDHVHLHMSSLAKSKNQESFRIYSDPNPSGINNPFAGTILNAGHSFGTMAERTKENNIPAKPWAGETLPQDTSNIVSRERKISVFKDHDLRKDVNIPVYKIIENVNATTNQISISKLDINLDLLHPPDTSEEYCLNEVLALMRGNYSTTYDVLADLSSQEHLEEQQHDRELETENQESHFMIYNDDLKLQKTNNFSFEEDEKNLDKVFMRESLEDIPNNGNENENSAINNSMNSSFAPNNKSPGITIFTKDANNEIAEMFKNKSSSLLEEQGDATENASPIYNRNIDKFKKKLTEGRIERDEEYTVDNIEEFTEHTKHNDVIKRFSNNRKLPIIKDFNSSLKGLQDDVLDNLENDVAELSMIENDEPDRGKSINGNTENLENGENPFFLTPVKRALSNKGSPFLIKKLKNDDEVFSPNFLTLIPKDSSATVIIDPFEQKTKLRFINLISSKVQTFKNYHTYASEKSTFKSLRLLSDSAVKKYNNKFINFEKTNELYSIKKKLGEGGFGMVFLLESSSSGKLDALKVESPASMWEFYIINVIRQRMVRKLQNCGIEKAEALISLKNSIVNVKKIHCYTDESYLVLDYLPQGNLLDILNIYKEVNGKPIDEILAIFFAKEIMKLVELLHSVNIIHGDLKPDNLMINFTDSLSRNISFNNKDDVSNYLSTKRLTLIDFGRAIDLELIDSPNYLFKTKLTSIDPEQDCPQIENNEPWKFEIDYFGIANIIHTMLFGEYIKLKFDGGMHSLKNKFKRYWQTEIWSSVFEFLLNPNNPNNPACLKDQRVALENFLYDEKNSYRNIFSLKQIILDIEYLLQSLNK